VLIAPLNWGLGHATRCVPVIDYLNQKSNIEVAIASDGIALEFLKENYPNLEHYQLPSYTVRYPKRNNAWAFTMNALKSYRGFINNIHKTQSFTEHLIKKHNFSSIISDHNLGCVSGHIPSAVITHQINIKSPIFQKSIRHINKKYLKLFSEIWVPDTPEASLSGMLCEGLEDNKHFLGVLSRLKRLKKTGNNLMVVLSGPEPQRSKLEEIIYKALSTYNGSFFNHFSKIIIIRGTNKSLNLNWHLLDKVTCLNLVDTNTLVNLFQSCSLFIGRSGYSTLMDLYTTTTNACLIPTPNQSEQLYLANRHSKTFLIQTQENFNIQAIESWFNPNLNVPPLALKEHSQSCMTRTIERFLDKI